MSSPTPVNMDIYNQELFKAGMETHGLDLKWIKKHQQTPEICMAAVQQNGLALEFSYIHTPEICRAAVEQNGLAIQFVDEKTQELCMIAVQTFRDTVMAGLVNSAEA